MTDPADKPGVIAPPPVLYLSALAAAFVLRWFWPLPFWGREAALWAGIALVSLAVLIIVWGLRTMVLAGTNVDPRRSTTTIVASGPFRFSRNPLYVGLTLIYLGLTTALDTTWGLVLLVPLLVVMHLGVVRREERYLEGKFGEIYRQYRAGVRRYL
jgi:protein-S-isoprenylcysteine O-methyltransferase Ste14